MTELLIYALYVLNIYIYNYIYIMQDITCRTEASPEPLGAMVVFVCKFTSNDVV
jgi:hypothetical protein